MIGKTILHYKITEKLGEGGMGEVYKAEDTKLKRDVAIKFLPRQIAAGLQTAHKKGVVHRDIKSANIMITDEDQVKIMDFGLAKLAGQTMLTKSGTTLGTVAYMSPEQARGEKVDQRTDIWSFGVVLYEMLTGQLPFKGDYEQAVMYSIMNEEPEPIAEFRSDVPLKLQQTVDKALQKKPDDRFKEMKAVLKDLRAIVREVESGSVASDSEEEQSLPSIAVLPFSNMSADPEQEYFCDGMAEEIINALTHVGNLHVVARTSAFSFKGQQVDIREIGQKLNVEHVLEGSVRKAGNRLRITAQLIKIADGYHLWSERYDRELDDVFAIQDEISLTIVERLKVELLGKEKAAMMKRHTVDIEAHNLYLKGRYFWNKWTPENFAKSLDFFGRAIDRDPNYAMAYTAWAEARAHWGAGYFNIRPIDIQKNRFDEAIAAFQKGVEFSGEHHSYQTQLAYANAKAGKKTEARKLLNELEKRRKKEYLWEVALAIAYTALGENGVALDLLEKAYEDRGGWIVWLRVEPGFDDLRDEPRFRALLKKIGLEE